MLRLLLDNPVVVLFIVLAAGTLVGAIRVGAVAAGPAGALFAGLALSAAVPELAGAVPPLVGTLGLALFAYTIGLAGGPSFFSGLRHHGGLMAATVAVFVVLAVLAVVIGRTVGLSAAEIAGVYAGATTNTPGVAAAVEVTGSNQPIVGYSLAYPFGVIGMILAVVAGTRWAQRHPNAEDRSPPEPASYSNVEVLRDDLPPLRELASFEGATMVFSRCRRGDTERTPQPQMRLEPGDIVTVIGPASTLPAFAEHLGREADRDLPLERHQVDFRRIVLSNHRYAGETIAGLDLARFQAVAGFVRRGDVDLAATPDLIVELGDRIRVVAPRDRLPEVVRELGDSERAVVVADPVGFSVGLLLGLALGLVPVPLAGTTFQLGSAAAPLVVGLLLGRLGRLGPVSWQLPYATNQTLRQFGAWLFLATVGLAAGPDLADALTSAVGPQLLALGALLTVAAAVALIVVARQLGLGSARLAGAIAGAQNQPAVLSFAVDRTDDDRVNLAYALLFPPTFVVKIVAAQMIATWA